MKHSEIKDLTLDELKQKIASEKESLRKLKFAHEVSAIENPMRLRTGRKLIARLHTELTAKLSKK